MKTIFTFLGQQSHFLLVALLLFGATYLGAQPVNDDCTNAIPLTINEEPCMDLSFSTVGTNVDAADSGVPDPGCASYAGGDVWFSVVVPASGEIAVETARVDDFLDTGLALYSGSCGSLTLLACDNQSGEDFFSFISLDGLTPGETLVIRVWTFGNFNAGEFSIFAYDPVPSVPIVNDDCTGATSLNVTAPGAPFDPVEGCHLEASDSGALPIPECNYAPSDLWYSVVVPASGYLTIEVLEGQGNRAQGIGMSLYTGSCGSLTEIQCGFIGFNDGSDDFIGGASIGENYGLNPGETIVVRIYKDGFSTAGIFSIQAYDPFDSPPANDICSGAIPVPLSLDPCNPSAPVEASTEGALDSETPDETCNTRLGISRDIWFSIEIPASGQLELNVEDGTQGGFGFDIEFLIGSCTDYSFFNCFGSGNQSISLNLGVDFEIGDFLYIRAASINSTSPITFAVSAYEPVGLSAPVNDVCSGAEVLPVNAVGQPYQPIIGCNIGATNSNEISTPCIDNTDSDVWYTVTVPASGYLHIFTSPLINIGARVASEIYSGTCGALVPVECGQEGEDNFDTSFIRLGEGDGIMAGETLYLRVWGANGLQTRFFIYAIDPFDNPPTNDLCTNAIALPINTGGCDLQYTTGTNVGALDSGDPDPTCGDFIGGDVWYSAIVPASGSITIITNLIPGSNFDDSSIEVYSGGCGALIAVDCDNDSGISGASRIELTAADGINPGDPLLIRLWAGDDNAIGNFEIAVFEPAGPPVNDICSNAIMLDVASGCENVVPTVACNEGATASPIMAPNCASYAGEDIWFSVTVPASGAIVVQTGTSFRLDTGMEIYSGDCLAPVAIACDADSGVDEFSSIELDAEVTAGQTLLVRIWVGSALERGSFEVYAYDPSSVPSNDECVGAIPVPVDLNNVCLPIRACNYGATISDVPLAGCDGGDDILNDVWFSMEVPASGVIAAGSFSNIFESDVALYSGTCGALVEILCEPGDEDFAGVAGLTPGETIYMRFMADEGPGDEGIFDVCAFSAPDPPVCGDLQYDMTITQVSDEIDAGLSGSNFTFPATPGTAQQGVIYISGRLDIEEPSEFVFLTEEGGTLVGTLSTPQDEGCSYTILSIPITGDQINAWAADGSIDFTTFVSPDARLNTCNPDAELSIRLVYCYCGSGVAPVAATTTKTLCNNPTLTANLANTGINVSNNLSANERVVWILRSSPMGSGYMDDMEFTTDNCGDAFKNFGILAVANTSKVIRINDIANAPAGTYLFDAYIENCVAGCESALTTGFSITVNEAPTVEISATPDGDLCLGTTGVQYDATITSTDGGTYTYDWCAYNSGDGSGTCFGGFDDNTVQAPKRNWVSSAGPKSVGITVESDAPGCSATDLYSFEVVAPVVLECPANQTVTLVTDPMNFDCLAEATFTNPAPIAIGAPCDPVTLSISVDGGAPEPVVSGEPYTAMFQELGVFTVTYNSVDVLGNTSMCTFDISVDGLPCGLADSGGLGCSSGPADFDQMTEEFTLEAGDCAPNTALYTEDQLSFVYTELCDDGEITVLVTGVEGTGFAGAMLRESELASAKKMALGTNTINRLRREVRVIDGYPSSAAPIASFNQFWIRVRRVGNVFSAFASSDGVFWQPYLSQVIIMEECILAGIYTYSEKAGNAVTATFENVTITGLANLGMANLGASDTQVNLGAPIAIGVQGLSLESEEGLKIFPNPTSGELNLDLSSFLGEAVDIRLFNSLGQLVYREQVEEVKIAVERLDMYRLPAGVYHVAVQVGPQVLTERVVVE